MLDQILEVFVGKVLAGFFSVVAEGKCFVGFLELSCAYFLGFLFLSSLLLLVQLVDILGGLLFEMCD